MQDMSDTRRSGLRHAAAAALTAAAVAMCALPAAATSVGNTTLVGPVYVSNGVAFEVDLASNLVYTPDGDGAFDSDLGASLDSVTVEADSGSPGFTGPDSVDIGVELEYADSPAGLVGIRVWVDGVEYSSLGPSPTVARNPADPGALEYIVHVMNDARFARGALLTITSGNVGTYQQLAMLDGLFTPLDPDAVIALTQNVTFQAIAAPVPVPLPVVGLMTGLGAMVLLRRRRAA
jgi:hypothetical protein